MADKIAILTYHSHNIQGSDTGNNDHVALREDLQSLHSVGMRFISLNDLLMRMDQGGWPGSETGYICLTFDDGCDFDTRDIVYPGHGLQRSFLGILQDFVERYGPDEQPGLHATSFVIASEEARRIIDERSLFARGWMSDDWWKTCHCKGLLSVGNHGWDHNHPDLARPGATAAEFSYIDTNEQCEVQVIRAGAFIASRSGAWPEWFAYPYGESSEFIREQFFPNRKVDHQCHAALGTQPGFVTADSDRWNLPRFVCGRDWRSPEQLLSLLI